MISSRITSDAYASDCGTHTSTTLLFYNTLHITCHYSLSSFLVYFITIFVGYYGPVYHQTCVLNYITQGYTKPYINTSISTGKLIQLQLWFSATNYAACSSHVTYRGTILPQICHFMLSSRPTMPTFIDSNFLNVFHSTIAGYCHVDTSIVPPS